MRKQFRNELLQDLMDLLGEDAHQRMLNVVQNSYDQRTYDYWRGYIEGLKAAKKHADSLVRDHFKEDLES